MQVKAATYGASSLPARFLAGEPEVVAEVGRWIARVLAARSFWSLRAEWADLHQEAMGRLVESLRRGRFDPTKDFTAYVQGVARFTAYKAVARDVRRARHTTPDDGSTEAADDRPEDRFIAQQLARQALEVASSECRELVRAYFMTGLSYAEIAALRSIPLGTVKSKLFRCMAAIQKALRGPRAGT